MTPEQREVMDDVVKDADAWMAHAVSHFGEEKAEQFLADKVARHSAAFEERKAQPDYKNRAQREAVEKEKRDKEPKPVSAMQQIIERIEALENKAR